MERPAHGPDDAATAVPFPRLRAGEFDLVRILRDRAYRQRFLDDLETLCGRQQERGRPVR